MRSAAALPQSVEVPWPNAGMQVLVLPKGGIPKRNDRKWVPFMDFEQLILQLINENGVLIAIAVFLVVVIFAGVRIVPQSEKHVVERFGRLRSVLGPGINFIIPFLDSIAHRVSVLERQLPTMSQDAITTDNVLVQVETSVFYRVIEPEKTVYRIRDIDAAIQTTVAGIVRSEIGRLELDEVQTNRATLTSTIKESLSTSSTVGH